MTREFVVLPTFEKCWASIGLTGDDLRELEIYLCLDPSKGDVISGTGSLRKLRWSLSNKGKRSGVRVLYVDFVIYEKIYFVSAYSKNSKADLTKAECKELKKLIGILETELKGRRKK